MQATPAHLALSASGVVPGWRSCVDRPRGGDPVTAPPSDNRRRPVAVACVALASLLAFVAILAIWVNRQVLDTDHWTDSSSQMLENPVIRDRVAAFLVDELYANVDVEAQVREALPPRAQPLAGPAAGALRNFAERAANEVLARPRAQQAWENANRSAHELLLKVLNGGGPAVSTTGGTVVIDLKQLLEELEARTGVGGRVAGQLPADAAQITVLRSDQLATAQDAARGLDALPIVTVALSLALFGIALIVAPGWRRQAARGYGFGLVAAGVAALATRSLTGDAVIDSLVPTEAGVPAGHELWTIVTQLLDQAAVAAIFYGLLLVLGAFLAGPTRPATAIRRVGAPYLREPAIAYGAFVVVVAAIVLWWAPTPAMRNPVTAVLLVVLISLGFEALRRRTAREFPVADRHELEGRARASAARAFGAIRERASGGGPSAVRRVGPFGPEQGNGGDGAPAPSQRVEQLERLGRLRESGVLDDEEFRAEKARILAAAR
jgi:hypothetical protein